MPKFITKIKPDPTNPFKKIWLFIIYMFADLSIQTLFEINQITANSVTIIAGLIAGIIWTLLVINRIYHYQSIHDRFKEKFTFKMLGKFVLYVLLMFVTVIILNVITVELLEHGHTATSANQKLIMQQFDQPSTLLFILVQTVIIAPRIEEFCFRYLPIGPQKRSRLNTWVRIVLSSLLFGMAHMVAEIDELIKDPSMLNTFVANVLMYAIIGGVLGYVYAKTHNYRYDMYMHSTWNTFGDIIILANTLH